MGNSAGSYDVKILKVLSMETSSFLDWLHSQVNFLSGYLWNGLIFLLLGTGIFFTISTGVVQIRLLGRSLKEMFASRQGGNDVHGITPFQAFVTGLASRVGVGNIAGVAIAIAVGGPGAVFWMWITALIGMSSAFAESSLAQLFKVRDHDNQQFRGGPAYYITKGLRQRWMAVLFALSLILTYGLVFNAVQANTITQIAAATWQWDEKTVGMVLCVLTLPIIFGGIRRIAKVAEIIVPVMALLYLLLAFYIVIKNVGVLPDVLALIFKDAFTAKSASGGFLGGIISIAMMNGIKRGLYSNEAGMGSAPNAAAAADVYHPVSQGLIQMLGVFVDTMIICSCTAFIILLSPYDSVTQEGIQLTQVAIVNHVGQWGSIFLTIAIFLFAYSTIIGNYAYAESNIQFLNSNQVTMIIFRLLVVGMVFFGAVTKVSLVWDTADLVMGIMAVINLVAILWLSPYVWLLLKDYTRQLRQGSKEPVFQMKEYPKLQGKVEKDIW
ncbi:Na+/alanine symporter [Suttonella ornithocola]|uniref:Na+/alanine symporter n=2 Tax=Suttonella ornithocola TaxID=279832 RepID=A0A380MN90_9GAMM|nr:Na+/alanine symporter [Suttonella ornithocola]